MFPPIQALKIFTHKIKMLTYEKKLEFLEKLKSAPIDLASAETTINYACDDVLAKPVLSSIVKELTDLDAHISVMHELLSPEEWEEIVADYDTPIEGENGKLRVKIKSFLSVYKHMDRCIHSFKVEDALDVLKTAMLSRTRNVQFLLFTLCLRQPQPVFRFLFRILSSNPTAYLPYLASLIVRCRVDEGVRRQCILAYVSYVRSLKRGNSVQYVMACQFFLYIACFRHEVLGDGADVIEHVFSSGLARHMNRTIVDIFCGLFGYECKLFFSYDHDGLYYFPFDRPILQGVADLIIDSYIEFQR
jgi:hypothetical protein